MDAPQNAATLTGNAKVTRLDWIDLALRTLLSEGVESVRILPLARKLGVSRSSFYWYFGSHRELLDQLLDHWRERNTKAIVERARRPSETIIRGIMNVFECWADERLFDPRLDFAVREWARRSTEVRRAVEEADEERLAAIRGMYLRHGYDEEEALIRARILYYMQIGYYLLNAEEPIQTRLKHLSGYLRSFSGQEPTQADVEHFRAFVDASRSRRPLAVPEHGPPG